MTTEKAPAKRSANSTSVPAFVIGLIAVGGQLAYMAVIAVIAGVAGVVLARRWGGRGVTFGVLAVISGLWALARPYV